MESKSISGVTSTCKNTCTTPVGHTEDDMAYLSSRNLPTISPEVQHQVPGKNKDSLFLVLRTCTLSD